MNDDDVTTLLEEATDQAEQQHEDPSPQLAPPDGSAPSSRPDGSPAGVRLERSFVSEYLDELIIAILFRCEEANGMDIIRELTHRFGVQFSPGTVYPHLHSLEEEGILARRECVQTKEYRIDDPEAARALLVSVLSQLTCVEAFLSETGGEAEAPDRPSL
jgi:DNA-binding transcriptional ArsR family regulator